MQLEALKTPVSNDSKKPTKQAQKATKEEEEKSDKQDKKNQITKWIASLQVSRNYPKKYPSLVLKHANIAELCSLLLYPNMKEFTECCAGFNALFPTLDSEWRRSKSVVCYCIGDGYRPQLAAMVTCQTAWRQVFCIDPSLQIEKWNKAFAAITPDKWIKQIEERVIMRKQKSQEFTEIVQDAPMSIVIGVHSHHDFSEFWKRLPSPAIGVAIPCCVEQVVDNEDPVCEFVDLGILETPCNGVKVWKK